MNVAIIGSFAPSLVNFRGSLISELVGRGHRVSALAPSIEKDVSERLRALGAEPCEFPVTNTGKNPISDLRTYWALKDRFRALRPDAILAYTVKPVVYGIRAAAAVGVSRRFALITGLGRSFDGRALTRLIVRRLYRAALRVVHHVFFQNPDDQRRFADEGILSPGNPSTVVNGSGVDLDHFAPREVSPDPACFLMASRLLGEKGVREFYQAAKVLKAKYPRARFRVVGSRAENPDAVSESELDTWRQEGVLECGGDVKDVRPELARSSVCILPSYYREGLPRSLLEAMATGRALITTDTPGCRETVIEGQNGFLIPPRDPEALARAMERFILDPELAKQFGRRSLELAREKFDVHKVNAVMIRSMGLEA